MAEMACISMGVLVHKEYSSFKPYIWYKQYWNLPALGASIIFHIIPSAREPSLSNMGAEKLHQDETQHNIYDDKYIYCHM